MKFKTLNYCGSNEGSYEIQNPSSPNAFPKPQTLRTTFMKKRQVLANQNNHHRKNSLQKQLSRLSQHMSLLAQKSLYHRRVPHWLRKKYSRRFLLLREVVITQHVYWGGSFVFVDLWIFLSMISSYISVVVLLMHFKLFFFFSKK